MTQKMSKNNYQIFILSIITMSLFCIQGCRKSQEHATPVPTAKPVAPATVNPVMKPVQKQVSSSLKLGEPQHNQFDFSSKKDPFKPYVIIKKNALLVNGKARNKSAFSLPIHSFDVNQFRLIGIISGEKNNQNQAMVVDPNGKGYVLKVGMTIGKNDGRIVSIASNGVEVLEKFRDDNGRVRKEHIRISMPRKQ